MSDVWYVAEPDGTTCGPMSRDEVVRAAGRGEFGSDALAWHVDLGEWLPLSRILLRFGRATQEAPSAAQVAKAERRDERSKQRQLPPSQRTEPAPKTSAEERKRRVATPTRPQPPALPGARASTRSDNPRTAAAAEESGRKLLQLGKRLLARYVDLMVIGMLGASIWWSRGESMRMPEAGDSPQVWLLLWMATIVLLPIESILIGMFGTTPGKHLLGLRLRDERGSAPGIARALRRSFHVYVRGIALGFPFLAPFAILIAGAQTLNKGSAPWDEGLRIEEESVTSRWQLIAFLVVLLWIAAANGWWLQLVQSLPH